MAQQAQHHLFTFADYLQIEEESGVRHELVGEMIVAMAGGSAEHAALGANVIHRLNLGLEGKRCRVYTSHLRVRIPATGLVTYPDASVVCGKLELDPQDPKGTPR